MQQNKENLKLVNISIPMSLFEKIKEQIEGTEFTSVSEFVTFALTEILKEEEEAESFSKEDEEQIKARLKALGYLE